MKAVRARLTTKFGKMEDTSTTRDSAAIRSRKSHIIHVKKATAVGRKFESQYAMTENKTDIKTRNMLAINNLCREVITLTEIGHPDEEIRDNECSRTIKAICMLFNKGGPVFQETGDVCHGHERHECRSKKLFDFDLV